VPSLDQVRELVGLVDQPDRPCLEAPDVAAVHLAEVRRKLEALRALEAAVAALVCNCEARCAGGAVADCAILEDLALAAGRASACCGSSPE